MVSPRARREQVACACARGLSTRQACGLLEISRSTLRYELRLPAKDAPVVAAMKEQSAMYPRYGYRRIRIFLQRQGFKLKRASRGRQAGQARVPTRRALRRGPWGRLRSYTPAARGSREVEG